MDEYLDRLDAAQAGQSAGPGSPGKLAGPDEGAPGGPASGRISAGELREARKELVRIDRQLQRLAGRESELHEALAAAAADYARLIDLGDELRAVQADKAALEDRWLNLAEKTPG